ncbi:MAG: CDP-alcohol phosphatidyltransferase family protein [Bacteroidetes bacterium]|nr:CDP-alcohol phosphatidyltransferase family protein [Bacteroidota bacterium]
MKKHIPNFITCLNLFSGCVGIYLAYQGSLAVASMFIGVAAAFDFFDGMAARLLHVKSEIGKELDSLADIISFGLLPGVIVFELLSSTMNLPQWSSVSINPYPFVAFLIPVFSALRLAKFNIDSRQTESFIGLPTPAAAIFLGSFPLILTYAKSAVINDFAHLILVNFFILTAITLMICWLLVAELPLFSLKFKNLKWKDNKPQFLLLLISIFLLLLLKFAALPVIIMIYVAISLIFRKNEASGPL